MLKFLVFILLVAAVIAFFVLRRTPKRSPRDWRHGGDDGGPILPSSQIGLGTDGKKANDTSSGGARETETTSSDSSGGDGGGD